MLVRFPWFRRILLTEKRDWPERLVFAASLGLPLTAGVICAPAARLQRRRPDARRARSWPACSPAPTPARSSASCSAFPPIFAGEWGALPFAIGCGFAGGGLREICPKEAIWHFSPFFFTDLHRTCGGWSAASRSTGSSILLAAPIGLEIMRRRSATSWPRAALRHPGAPTPGCGPRCWSRRCCRVAIPIKIWNSARIEHRLQEQEKLLMAARVEALANQINPHFLFNTLTSISSLIRSKPETARMLIVKLSGLLRRLLRSQEHFVTLREELEADRRVPRHRAHPLRPAAAGREAHRPGDARPHRAEHDAAAARRELDQARAVAQARRRPHHDPQPARAGPRDHRRDRQRRRHSAGGRPAASRAPASACATSTSGCG